MCSESLLTHLSFPRCVTLVGDLAHLECSSSDPPYLVSLPSPLPSSSTLYASFQFTITYLFS